MKSADIFDSDESDSEELVELRADLADIIDQGQEVWARQRQAQRVRFNQWDGQSDDGRKHAADIGT